MINESELYTQALYKELWESKDNELFGTTYIRYEVRQLVDVRNLKEVKSYSITCTQRVVIPNATKFEFSPADTTKFKDYPALLSSEFGLQAHATSNVRLLNYSPRTVNTTITGSTSQSKAENQSISRQHTSGSSTSETNTYGTSASLGFFGDAPTGSIGFDYSHSSTSEQNRSATAGRERGSSAEHGQNDTMSLKDWAGYAYLRNRKDADGKDIETGYRTPTWVWGQEYPWDLIQYRYFKSGAVQLPDFVKDRMLDNSNPPLVLPPSQLSLFGIDFTMKAAWLVDLSPDIAQQDMWVQHLMDYMRATHELKGGKLTVEVDTTPQKFKVDSPKLDLTLLGLDPVRDGSAQNGAVIGFIPSKFVTAPPKAAADKFKIISEANTLQVTGHGFDKPMLANVTAANKAILTMQFKIVDTRCSYTLFMKHWKTTEKGCKLTFVFNKKNNAEQDEANTVTRHVDWNEGEGGEDNLSSIVMRNKDYTSVDYHDYLAMGLNSVEITIEPIEAAASAGYFLRALAIGEE